MTDSKLKNTLYILSGMGVLAVGLIGAGIGVLGIINPVGAKLSDDSHPFGPPVSRLWSAAIALFFALVVAFGFWVISLADKKTKD